VTVDRLSVKVFAPAGAPGAPGPAGVKPRDLIPIFHRFIQGRGFPELAPDQWIDVADYSHVHEGPGVLLIGDAADYGVDVDDGGLGLRYTRKRAMGALGGDLTAQLTTAARTTLAFARRLEAELALHGRLTFDLTRLRVRLLDRLHAPNTAEAYAALEPALRGAAVNLYDERSVAVGRVLDDPGGCLAADLREARGRGAAPTP
jgi:hypothetical protein